VDPKKTEVLCIRVSSETRKRYYRDFHRVKSRNPQARHDDFLNLLLDYFERYHIEWEKPPY